MNKRGEWRSTPQGIHAKRVELEKWLPRDDASVAPDGWVKGKLLIPIAEEMLDAPPLCARYVLGKADALPFGVIVWDWSLDPYQLCVVLQLAVRPEVAYTANGRLRGWSTIWRLDGENS